jgi:hypothetical protein
MLKVISYVRLRFKTLRNVTAFSWAISEKFPSLSRNNMPQSIESIRNFIISSSGIVAWCFEVGDVGVGRTKSDDVSYALANRTNPHFGTTSARCSNKIRRAAATPAFSKVDQSTEFDVKSSPTNLKLTISG